ncbi:MAG: PadR family transcriptional regulator [Gemmatimonadota bacterium]|nr:PadR family transcriptional regulator [Gemmatimonadota bacterium]
MPRKPSTEEGASLTPLMFQILVALTGEDRHGYAIMQEIENRTGGAFTIGAGTMYRTIKQLLDAGFLKETVKAESGHRQRRYYRITATGRRRAAQEARVFHSMVEWAAEADLLDSDA